MKFRGMKMTAREYDANLNGIHMLFGAMLGIVLAGPRHSRPGAS